MATSRYLSLSSRLVEQSSVIGRGTNRQRSATQLRIIQKPTRPRMVLSLKLSSEARCFCVKGILSGATLFIANMVGDLSRTRNFFFHRMMIAFAQVKLMLSRWFSRINWMARAYWSSAYRDKLREKSRGSSHVPFSNLLGLFTLRSKHISDMQEQVGRSRNTVESVHAEDGDADAKWMP